MKNLLLSLLLFCAPLLHAQQPNIIPQPVKVELGRGTASMASTTTKFDASLPADGYILKATKRGIAITAQSPAGEFYARQTLQQLRDQYGENIPQLTVTDYPRYQWRGLMLDCSRHFYTLEYLKKQVDLLARYKMNRLHLHLTDDQGWRIEIKRYPELTQQGAWREFNQQDSICLEKFKDQPEFELDPRFIIHHDGRTLYGGYYTQEQLRDLVAYAAERHIEIIPEIDMPGHTQAISAIHPEFTATGEASWGTVFSVPLSPAKEEVYDYLQNILDEVIDIFPSRFVHIGADEVEKETWKQSEACRSLMQREGIESYEQLQSYFVHRIQKYLESKGREVICWDDAMEGGLDASANVMYWRYWVAGVPEKAINEGHNVIFTPGAPMYIAHPEDPMYNIYHFTGLDQIPTEKQHLVRGGQACLWAEETSNFRRADYCIYPRLLALSELLWTPTVERNWTSFKKRLEREKQWLTAHDVQYAKTVSLLTATQSTDLQNRQMLVTFDSEYAEPDIRYTLDGTVPTMSSPRFDGTPVAIREGEGPVFVTAAIMNNGKPEEPMFRREIEFHKAVGAKVEYTTNRWYESYKASEVATFTDGKRGSLTGYGDGLWQGFLGKSFQVVVDLGQETDIHSIAMRFQQDIAPGIQMPGSVDFAISTDGKNYSETRSVKNDVPEERGTFLKDFTVEYPEGTRARYIRIDANNTKKEFIFADEIVVK